MTEKSANVPHHRKINFAGFAKKCFSKKNSYDKKIAGTLCIVRIPAMYVFQAASKSIVFDVTYWKRNINLPVRRC
nr:hypothetical protein [uncultured Anaerotignum sp.]